MALDILLLLILLSLYYAYVLKKAHIRFCRSVLFVNHDPQVYATVNNGIEFDTTVTGRLLAEALAVKLAFTVGRGLTACVHAQEKTITVKTERDGSRRLMSALALTKSLPILGSPLGVRMCVVGKAGDVSGGAVEQAVVSTSEPLRVRNEGIDVTLDLLLDGDSASLEEEEHRVRVSVVRPQLLENELEMSRVEVSAGAFSARLACISMHAYAMVCLAVIFVSVVAVVCWVRSMHCT